MKSREIAYLALLSSLKEEGFIASALDTLQQKEKLTPADYAFAYEIAAGSARMALALDYIGEKMSAKLKLSLKLKEKALMREAIYQHCFMDKVPLYAIVNETIEIAKKYCHSSFVKFLNALLRKMELELPKLPSSDSLQDLSIRLSYPLEFVKSLVRDYGLESAKNILTASNIPPKTMVRIRPVCSEAESLLHHIEKVKTSPLPIGMIKDRSYIEKIASSSNFYIQNITPVALMDGLMRKTSLSSTAPLKVLDLCASPGGKLLLLNDLFPKVSLFANDISDEKVGRLKENLLKYSVSVDVKCGAGENYGNEDLSLSNFFDLVVLDVPCTNSGVLNKRPEARFRIASKTIAELQEIQLKLLSNAFKLIRKGGEIWFMTCSILKEENEKVIEKFCKSHPVKVIYSQTILPDSQGFDGGFACLLQEV